MKVWEKDIFRHILLMLVFSTILTACGSDNKHDNQKNIPEKPVIASKDAIVVGAGLSGLTAAYELEQQGFKVTVIEARDRVGGRVATIEMGSQTGEIGGELIDGETVHKQIHHYASLFNVALADVGYDGDIEEGAYYIDGQLVSYTDFDNGYNHAVVTDYYRFKDQLKLLADAVPDPENPAELPLAKEYDLVNVQTWLDGLQLNPIAKQMAEQFIRGEFDEPSNLSLLHVAQYSKVYENVSDDDVESTRFLKGGVAMTQAYVDNIQGDIVLSQPVAKIEQVDNKITVTTSTQSTYTSDVIVVTVPLTVLNKITFSPTLPDAMTQAADNINYGTHSKVLLQYSKRFWLEQKLGGDTVVASLPTGWTWETTERQGGEGGILIAYTSGDFSKMQKEWTDQQVIDTRLAEIELMYPGSSDYFIAAKAQNWINEAWTKGGYLAYGPGQVNEYWKLFEVPVGRIYFAGEHTDTLYLGYMEGAVRSGVRVAQQIKELGL
ncbi:L-amino acid dehydrogenase [Pseudoalteromonas holothuriae]|uniref:L-amino acid dehydrogenase n=1 Tax=Pseudoalteromonas holothuriae TaxID=2963714 RepID=A0A9W4QUC5_9GAMM|nr:MULTISPECIES: FAD-dependent oxidoreductase [unclassified Pseudoalteromonas]CAH9049728.1 L-amino acid dehydrogenase [Pseudoalteromonas sp. CIP111951]CAH9053121.1 L-amino acid dehydrogenase [Pseudoalteromonas sp. CIP111854]